MTMTTEERESLGVAVAIANAISDVDASPPPGRSYVDRLVKALEARGYTVAMLPRTADE